MSKPGPDTRSLFSSVESSLRMTLFSVTTGDFNMSQTPNLLIVSRLLCGRSFFSLFGLHLLRFRFLRLYFSFSLFGFYRLRFFCRRSLGFRFFRSAFFAFGSSGSASSAFTSLASSSLSVPFRDRCGRFVVRFRLRVSDRADRSTRRQPTFEIKSFSW